MATAEEIRINAKKLEAAGAPSQDIEDYVRLAAQELQGTDSNPNTAKMDELMGQAIPPIVHSLGKGMIEGATLGRVKLPRSPEGSVLETNSDKYGRPVGKFVGSILPIVAAEATGGAGMALAGAGPVVQAAGSGLVYGAAEGAANNLAPLETLAQSAKSAAAFGSLGAVGQGLGYLRKVFGENISSKLANVFLETPKRTAEKLANAGEESLGTQVIKYKGRFEDKPLAGFKSQKEVLDKAKNELELLRNESSGIIEGIQQEADKKILKPLSPPVPLLGYEPNAAKTTGPIHRRPAIEPTDPMSIINSAPHIERRGVAKYPGYEYQDPAVGTIGGFDETGLRTAPRQFTKGGSQGTFMPEKPVSSGGFLDKDSRKKFNEIVSGTERVKKLHADASKYSEELATKESQRVEKLKKSLGVWGENYPYTIESKGPFVSLKDIASDLDSMIGKTSRVGKRTGPAKAIQSIKDDFINSNPEITSVQDALSVKTTLDRIVNDAYDKQLIDTTVRDQVYRKLANGIRREVYKISPELGSNFDKQSLMHDVIGTLKSTQADYGKIGLGSFTRILLRQATDSSATLGMATLLERNLGAPSKFIAPAIGKAARVLAAPIVNQYE